MTSSPYFSIIIDNYNYGRFLAQAIESVLKQDFPEADRELIVVDDGSTDNSREVAASYPGKLTLIAQKNQGQAGAFAAGYAAAKGEIICLLDADDWWDKSKLSKVAVGLTDKAVGIVQHYQRDVDAGGRPLQNPLPDWPAKYALKDFLDGRFINAATSSLAIRRGVLDKVLPVPKDIFYLYDDFILDHGLFFADISNVREILGYHRIHGANNWAQNYLDPGKLEGSIREVRAFYRHLEPRLDAARAALSPRHLDLVDLELRKREILLATHRGRRADAFRLWRLMSAAHGRTPFGAFRCATCLLALASPRLYLKAYALYGRKHWMAGVRRAVLPEP